MQRCGEGSLTSQSGFGMTVVGEGEEGSLVGHKPTPLRMKIAGEGAKSKRDFSAARRASGSHPGKGGFVMASLNTKSRSLTTIREGRG
jgi:hypothetical protein